MKRMANGHGGSRTPSNPAPVSAPGALSRRTDGGPQQVNAQMTGMAYGDNADFMDIQSGAPMAATPGVRPSRGGAAPAGPGATSLFSPTQRPNEPVTAGAPFGPGAGPDAGLTSTGVAQQDAAMLGKYLPGMMEMANQPNTPDGFKRFVRHLRNMQGGQV